MITRLLGLFCAATLVLAGWAGSPARAQASIETSAPHALLIDVGTGTVLLEKAADTLMAPASMAKLMTAELVFHEIASGRLSLEQEVVVSANAWRTGGAPSGSSTMFAPPNSRHTVRDLLRAAIIISANDASIALAEAISGSEAAFAQRMTQRARDIGLTRSQFRNSTGLPHPEQRVTARELARLAIHMIRTYPQFYPWYAERELTTGRRTQQNRNPLLREVPGSDGLKTGMIRESGFGLVGSTLRGEQRLILVLNGLETERERAQEARKLMEWGFRTFESRLLFAPGEAVGEGVVFGGANARVPLAPSEEVRVLTPRGVEQSLRARIVYSGPIIAPVERGRVLGRVQIFNGQTLAIERPLVAGEAVAQGSLIQRGVDALWEAGGRLWRWANRPAAAEVAAP